MITEIEVRDCRECGQVVDCHKVEAAIRNNIDWQSIGGRWGNFQIGSKVPIPELRGTITFVAFQGSTIDEYEEGRQGHRDEIHVVLRLDVPDLMTDSSRTFFFRKEGTGDSYGNLVWDGPFSRVIPTEKKVTVYEFD
jgi:hypothetical protein